MKTAKKILFIVALALTCGLATTLKAQNLYVANLNNTIGEYGLDGSTVIASLISGLGYPGGIGCDGVVAVAAAQIVESSIGGHRPPLQQSAPAAARGLARPAWFGPESL